MEKWREGDRGRDGEMERRRQGERWRNGEKETGGEMEKWRDRQTDSVSKNRGVVGGGGGGDTGIVRTFNIRRRGLYIGVVEGPRLAFREYFRLCGRGCRRRPDHTWGECTSTSWLMVHSRDHACLKHRNKSQTRLLAFKNTIHTITSGKTER